MKVTINLVICALDYNTGKFYVVSPGSEANPLVLPSIECVSENKQLTKDTLKLIYAKCVNIDSNWAEYKLDDVLIDDGIYVIYRTQIPIDTELLNGYNWIDMSVVSTEDMFYRTIQKDSNESY